jgi:hypothetical protein
MATASSNRSDADPLLLKIGEDLDSLARLIEQAIEAWPTDENSGADIERLERAKQAAEHGAARTRSQFLRN